MLFVVFAILMTVGCLALGPGPSETAALSGRVGITQFVGGLSLALALAVGAAALVDLWVPGFWGDAQGYSTLD